MQSYDVYFRRNDGIISTSQIWAANLDDVKFQFHNWMEFNGVDSANYTILKIAQNPNELQLAPQ